MVCEAFKNVPWLLFFPSSIAFRGFFHVPAASFRVPVPGYLLPLVGMENTKIRYDTLFNTMITQSFPQDGLKVTS